LGRIPKLLRAILSLFAIDHNFISGRQVAFRIYKDFVLSVRVLVPGGPPRYARDLVKAWHGNIHVGIFVRGSLLRGCIQYGPTSLAVD